MKFFCDDIPKNSYKLKRQQWGTTQQMLIKTFKVHMEVHEYDNAL